MDNNTMDTRHQLITTAVKLIDLLMDDSRAAGYREAVATLTTANKIPAPSAKSRPEDTPDGCQIEGIRQYVMERDVTTLSRSIRSILDNFELEGKDLAALMGVHPARVSEALNGHAGKRFTLKFAEFFGAGKFEPEPVKGAVDVEREDTLRRFRAAVGKIGSAELARKLGMDRKRVQLTFDSGSGDDVLKRFTEVYA